MNSPGYGSMHRYSKMFFFSLKNISSHIGLYDPFTCIAIMITLLTSEVLVDTGAAANGTRGGCTRAVVGREGCRYD